MCVPWLYDPVFPTRLRAWGETALDYDTAGNVVAERSPAGTTTYEWDDDNRLARISFADGRQNG